MGMTTQPAIEPVEEQFYNQNQSWHYSRVVAVGDARYRVRIRRNAYDQQSFAVAEKWTANGWQQVIDRPIEACACKVASYTRKTEDPAPFNRDADSLLAAAITVGGYRA